jgi:hypothetical protein
VIGVGSRRVIDVSYEPRRHRYPGASRVGKVRHHGARLGHSAKQTTGCERTCNEFPVLGREVDGGLDSSAQAVRASTILSRAPNRRPGRLAMRNGAGVLHYRDRPSVCGAFDTLPAHTRKPDCLLVFEHLWVRPCGAVDFYLGRRGTPVAKPSS